MCRKLNAQSVLIDKRNYKYLRSIYMDGAVRCASAIQRIFFFNFSVRNYCMKLFFKYLKSPIRILFVGVLSLPEFFFVI